MAAGWRLASRARTGEAALPTPVTRMNATSTPRGMPGTSPARLMTRTISNAVSASRPRPVRKFCPSRWPAASTALMLTLSPTKSRPLRTALAAAAARKKTPQASGLYPAVMRPGYCV